MDKSTERVLNALLAHANLEPKDGDLERFSDLLDEYVACLRRLHSVDLSDEPIAPTFNPEWKGK